MSSILDKWILEWSLKDEQYSEWRPFGEPHSLEEILVCLDDVRERMPSLNWRIVPVNNGLG
jgi:hypothetical protein